MVTKKDVLKALQDALDPETGISVVDMGLIRDVKVSGDKVDIKMTLTTPFCPLASQIQEEVKKKAKIPGVKKVDVEIVF
jgi:metal-sulfur cluster biosynthetic enzyme